MKIVRYFCNAQSEESGIEGFLPMWVPGSSNFDPGSPTLMVHDMLEHRACDQGHFHEELMAFGRVIALRVLPHVGDRYGPPSAEGLGIEIGGVWADEVESTGIRIAHAPKTTPLSEDNAEVAVQQIAERAMKAGVSEMQARNPDSEFRPSARLHAAMVGWMRVGYLDALRRYGEQDRGCYDVGHAAFSWAHDRSTIRKFENHESPDGGTVVARLEFDTRELRMRHRFYVQQDDRPFPEWLRNKLWAWRHSRQLPVQSPAFINA